MRKDKFVVDNNIWISYLITQTEQRLVDIINNNDLVIFSCKELFEELNRVLNYSHLKNSM
jgi:putative PIN family toxin of toxin-antitoxin system